MKLTLRIWNLFSILVLSISGSWIAYSSFMIAPPVESVRFAPQIGQNAPPFTLLSIDGETHTLGQEKGKIVLVNFFASWCPPCKAEMPAMQKIYSTYNASGLEIFAVTNLRQDNLADLNLFFANSAPQFPILLDENGAVYEDYAIRAMPTTFLIDQDGRIRKIFYGGPLSEGLLATEIERLLKRQ